MFSLLIPLGENKISPLGDLPEFLIFIAVEEHSPRSEKFHSIPLNRVVACGDGDPSSGVHFLNCEGHGRRGANANCHNIASHLEESGIDAMCDARPGDAPVPADNDRPPVAVFCEGCCIFYDDVSGVKFSPTTPRIPEMLTINDMPNFLLKNCKRK